MTEIAQLTLPDMKADTDHAVQLALPWEDQKPDVQQIKLDDILRNPDALSLQQRENTDPSTLYEYSAAINAGDILPPIVLFRETIGEDTLYWVADGIHRLLATRRTGRTTIDAIVYTGSKRDALLYAVGANATHGLRRTNGDKRKAVLTLLQDDEWCRLSDREIARLTRTSHPFVGLLRRQMRTRSEQSANTPVSSNVTTATEAHQSDGASTAEEQTADAPVSGNVTTATEAHQSDGASAADRQHTQQAKNALTTTTPPTAGVAVVSASNVTTPPPTVPDNGNVTTAPQEDYRSAVLEALGQGRGMSFPELFRHIIGGDDRDPALRPEWYRLSATLQKLVEEKLVTRITGIYYARPPATPPTQETNGNYEHQKAGDINIDLGNLHEALQHAYIAIFAYTIVWELSLRTPPDRPVPRLNKILAHKTVRLLRDTKDSLEHLLLEYEKRDAEGTNVPAAPEKPGYCPECGKEGTFIGTLFLDKTSADDVFTCRHCASSFTVPRTDTKQGA